MQKIGIITDSIREKKTGIGYYSENLTNALLKFDKKNKFYFIDYEKNDFNRQNLIFVKNPFQNFFKTYTWHNILPLITRKLDLDYIFNLSGCPHLFPFKQKEFFFVYDLTWLVMPETHTQSRVLIYKLLFNKTVRNSYKIVVISQSTKRDLVKYYKVPENKILLIYPRLPKQAKIEVKPKIDTKIPYILFIGTLEPRKNIDSLIKAFYRLKTKVGLPHQLVISGKGGWKYSSIFRLIEELKLKNDVTMTDYVTEEEKEYLYNHADVFVYPSFYEGFGIPPLEAMSHGCPVITSNTSSLPEVVGDAAIMINPHDVNALAEAMGKVLTDGSLRREMIGKGLKQAKKFNGEEFNKKEPKIYKEIYQ